MENTILEAIAQNSVFSLAEVKRVYDIFKSFDLLVRACAYAQKHGNIDLELSCIWCSNNEPTEEDYHTLDGIYTIEYINDHTVSIKREEE